MFTIENLDHIGLAVSDLQTSIEWYKRVLLLEEERHADWGDSPVMMVGKSGSGLALFPSKEGLPAGISGLPHYAFKVNAGSFGKSKAHLTSQGISWYFQDHTISQSIYFRDPDNHLLEITCYEIDKIIEANET